MYVCMYVHAHMCVCTCMHMCAQWCLTLCDPFACSLPDRLLCSWNFPGKNTGAEESGGEAGGRGDRDGEYM